MIFLHKLFLGYGVTLLGRRRSLLPSADIMALYWGWVVCVAFVTLFTLAMGIQMAYCELLVPMSKDLNSSMAMLSKL